MHHGTVGLTISADNVSQRWRTGIGEVRACRITCDMINAIVSRIWIDIKLKRLMTAGASCTTADTNTVDIQIRRC